MKETQPRLSATTAASAHHHHDRVPTKKETEDDDHQDEAIRIWDCGSPLYDSYELVSLSHVIDRHIMVLPSLSGSRISQQKSSRSSHASNSKHHVIPSLFSSSNSSKEAAASKKAAARGSSFVVATFFSKLTERNIGWNRRICGEREEMKKKPKKLKISSGICNVYKRISSLRK